MMKIHQYGIMTDVDDMSMGMSVMVNYTMELNGQSTSFVSQGTKYPVQEGPFVLKGTLQQIDKITQLHSVRVERVEGRTLVTEQRDYAVFDNMQVYELRDGEYYLSNLERVKDGNYQLTAWYDKTPGEGGCVRILVAKEK